MAEKKFIALDLADALGINRFEFYALVQLGDLEITDEITETQLKKIYKKRFGGE